MQVRLQLAFIAGSVYLSGIKWKASTVKVSRGAVYWFRLSVSTLSARIASLCRPTAYTFTASLNFIDIWEFHTCLASQLHTFKRAHTLWFGQWETLSQISEINHSGGDLFGDNNRDYSPCVKTHRGLICWVLCCAADVQKKEKKKKG